MNFLRFFPSLLASIALTLLPALAGEGWGTDYNAALASALKENRNVLLDFTGSDWCGWCVKLKKDTFDQPAFKEYADKNLVLIKGGVAGHNEGLVVIKPAVKSAMRAAHKSGKK